VSRVSLIHPISDDRRRHLSDHGVRGDKGEVEMRGAKIDRRSDRSVADSGFATGRDVELEEDAAGMLGGSAGADEEAGNERCKTVCYHRPTGPERGSSARGVQGESTA
jgi:hypothetical protein